VRRRGETWQAIIAVLRYGWRGLPGGDSLARLLVHHGRRPGLWGPLTWTAAEDDMVRTLRPREAARRTGRSLAEVYARRSLLRLPDARKKYT
jgi:hypothetical protein